MGFGSPATHSITSRFIPPDHEDVHWRVGAETFDRTEIQYLLWAQRAMISNDLKRLAGEAMTDTMFEILKCPRIPEF